MKQSAATITNPSLVFDLAALDAVLGPKGFASALSQDKWTGRLRYAALTRDSFEDSSLVRITASYLLSFAGLGRSLYTLVELDLKLEDGVAIILCARQLGRLAPIAPLAGALLPLARQLASGELPTRAQLEPFLPADMLDRLQSDIPAADFPATGMDREEKLPETYWQRPAVLHHDQVDAAALAVTLNLTAGERTQLAHMEPASGDYRVFHLGINPTPPGGQSLTFQLHRQAPSYTPRFFDLLTLTLGPCNDAGLCPVEKFKGDAVATIADLPQLLVALARIAAMLQAKERPDDALLLPFMSESSRNLWSELLSAQSTREGDAA